MCVCVCTCARACPHVRVCMRVCEKKNVQRTNNEIIISTLLKETYIFEKKDSDEVRKKLWRPKELWKET